MSLTAVVTILVACSSPVDEPAPVSARKIMPDLVLLQSRAIELFGAQATTLGPTRVLLADPSGRVRTVLDDNGVGLGLSASGEYWIRLQLTPGQGAYVERMRYLATVSVSGGQRSFDLGSSVMTIAADQHRDSVWVIASGHGLELSEHRISDGQQAGRSITIEAVGVSPCGPAPTLAIAGNEAYLATATCPPSQPATILWRLDLAHRRVISTTIVPIANYDVPVAPDPSGNGIAIADAKHETLYRLDSDLHLVQTIVYGDSAPPSAVERMKRPGGVARIVWSQGNMYVASAAAGPASSIRIIDLRSGQVTRVEVPEVVGLVVWRGGVVAVSASKDGSVWEISPAGSAKLLFSALAPDLVGAASQ